MTAVYSRLKVSVPPPYQVSPWELRLSFLEEQKPTAFHVWTSLLSGWRHQ